MGDWCLSCSSAISTAGPRAWLVHQPGKPGLCKCRAWLCWACAERAKKTGAGRTKGVGARIRDDLTQVAQPPSVKASSPLASEMPCHVGGQAIFASDILAVLGSKMP
eukprot:991952-Pyramimonas_sp.AAC.1